jgi:anti-sigma factor RsiW
MNARVPQPKCSERCILLYVDGELDASRALAIEEHLAVCEACRAKLELSEAMRRSLRRSASRKAPAELADRVRARLGAVEHAASATSGEVAMPRAVPSPDAKDVGRARWQGWVGVASGLAASVALVFFAMQRDRSAPSASASEPRDVGAPEKPEPASRETTSRVASAGMGRASMEELEHGSHAADDSAQTRPALPAAPVMHADTRRDADAGRVDEVIDQFVALHANPLPAEERNPENLVRLEPFVGVPLQRPAMRLMRSGALATALREDRAVKALGANPSFDGARLHPVRESRGAAALRYVVDGHRVTVYVFDPHVVPLQHTKLERRHMSAGPMAPVYVGHMRGFSVAAAERSGIGYALATDFDEDKTARMVASF